MPLTFADAGVALTIKKVGGKPEIRQHLETMGFVVGAVVIVISTIRGNVIVNVKETRVAISKKMAEKILV